MMRKGEGEKVDGKRRREKKEGGKKESIRIVGKERGGLWRGS